MQPKIIIPDEIDEVHETSDDAFGVTFSNGRAEPGWGVEQCGQDQPWGFDASGSSPPLPADWEYASSTFDYGESPIFRRNRPDTQSDRPPATSRWDSFHPTDAPRTLTPPIDKILDLLDNVSGSGPEYTARCPAHHDQRNSLSIREAEDGRILLFCHAGCETQGILEELGLTYRDLFPPEKSSSASRRPHSEIAATYDYVDADGRLLYQVVRMDPKDFRQRRPDGRGGWSWKLGGVERVLYRLPDILASDPDEPVFVVEGEKDADRLHNLGLVATTNAGGAGKWRSEYTDHLRDRDVVVLPDNDDAGRKHAEQVAWFLHGFAKSTRIIELPDLPPKGDISDWLDAGGTVEVLRQLVDRAPAWNPTHNSHYSHNSRPADHLGDSEYYGDDLEEMTWEPPIPLTDAPRPAFPTEALPNWLKEFVEAEAVATQTPPDLAGMIALSVLGSACAQRVEVRVRGGWTEPVNLYTVVALPPGNRKSAVFKDVSEPLEEHERLEQQRLAPDIAEGQNKQRVLEASLQHANRLAATAKDSAERTSFAEEASRIARELADLEVPALPRFIADDVSPEKLGGLLAEQGGRMAVLSAEGGIFDLMAGKYSANGAPNLDVFLKGHAGDTLRVDRVGRPSEFVPSPALTVGLAVQPDVVQGLANKPGFRGRGLLARFLYAVPTSLVGRRQVAPPPVPDEIAAEYRRRITELLRLPQGTDSFGETVPHVLRLSTAAERLLTRFMEDLEPRLGDGGDLEVIADWASKLAGAVVRIAGLLHLAGSNDVKEPWTKPIDGETMDGAIRIGEYLVAHALAAFGLMGADPAAGDARHLLRWIESKGLETFTKRDLYQGVRGRFKTVDALDAPLRLLIQHAYIRERPDEFRQRAGRKPSPTLEVNPLWRSRNPQNPHIWASIDHSGILVPSEDQSPPILTTLRRPEPWNAIPRPRPSELPPGSITISPDVRRDLESDSHDFTADGHDEDLMLWTA